MDNQLSKPSEKYFRLLEKRMARTDSQAVNRAEDGIHGDDPQGL
jgi:hypothetical protein